VGVKGRWKMLIRLGVTLKKHYCIQVGGDIIISDFSKNWQRNLQLKHGKKDFSTVLQSDVEKDIGEWTGAGMTESMIKK